MRSGDAVFHRHIGSGDTPTFTLYGGIYQVQAVGFASGGSATLYQLAADAVSWLSVHTAFTTNSGDTIYLPPGTFKWTVAVEANVSVGITRVPGE